MLTTVSFAQLLIATIWKICLTSLTSINIHFYNGIKINNILQACQHLYFAFFSSNNHKNCSLHPQINYFKRSFLETTELHAYEFFFLWVQVYVKLSALNFNCIQNACNCFKKKTTKVYVTALNIEKCAKSITFTDQ